MGAYSISGVSIGIFSLILCGFLAWHSVHDTVSCSIQGAGVGAVNGYYAATDGMYLRRGDTDISHMPDFFEVVQMSQSVSSPAVGILFHGEEWDVVILSQKGGRAVYASKPDHPERHVMRPPQSGWTSTEPGLGLVSPTAVACHGDLARSANGQVSPTDNIEKILRRPITTALLLINAFVAYYLWAHTIDVSAVSFSYDSVCSGDYWRMATASFSHFDLMHIGFNLMSLYQLGDLEFVYGSVAFLYLNIDLVFITMLICLGITYIRMTYFGHVEIQYQQSIGFSCVLFAWMVAASVRMNQYCPLFFLPSLCFDTWHLGIPYIHDSISLPINFGPFVLLLVTKLILPRTSLVGHFSGIVIGFPLAWNAINWLTPDAMCVCLLLALCTAKGLWPWSLTGFATSNSDTLSELFPTGGILIHLRIKVAGFIMLLLSLFGAYSNGYLAVAPVVRIVISVYCCYAHHIVRCLWISELRLSKHDCMVLLGGISISVAVAVVCDVASVVSCWTSEALLVLSCGLPKSVFMQGECFYAAFIAVELYFLYLIVLSMNITPEAKNFLKTLRLDSTSVQRDLDMFDRIFCFGRICREDNVIQGQGYQLRSSNNSANSDLIESTSSDRLIATRGQNNNIEL